MRTTTVLTATTLLACATEAPAGATYEGQDGRIAFGAFVATDRTQADIWSVRPGEVGAASAHRRPRTRHLPRLLRRRQAHRVLQQPDRRLRDLGHGREREGRTSGHPARDASALPGLLARRQPDRLLRTLGGREQHRPVDVPTAGGAPTRITQTPDVEEKPVWSPDGSTVLYVASPATTPAPSCGPSTWRPDGRPS